MDRRLLTEFVRGDSAARAEVLATAHPRLCRIADRLIAREPRAGLTSSDLVHEIVVRRIIPMRVSPQDTEHFYRLAARAMRLHLIDIARARRNRQTMAGSEAAPPAWVPEDRMTLRDLLDRLGVEYPDAAAALRLRYMEGRTVKAIAGEQKRPEWRVRADCEFALEYLRQQLTPRGNPIPRRQPADHEEGTSAEGKQGR